MDLQQRLRHLARAARRAEIRVRLDAALRRAVVAAPLPLLYAAVALSTIKLFHPPAQIERWLVWGAAVPVAIWLGLVAAAWLRRRPERFGAQVLDRYHGYDDRVTSALEFAEFPPERRTPFVLAAISDALDVARRLEPRRAAPIRIPRETGVVVLLCAGLTALALLEVRTYRVIQPKPSIDPLVMSHDDVALFRDLSQDLANEATDPETRRAVRRFNQLVEDIAERRLERRDVFKRLAELERDLQKSVQAENEALEEGLKSLAKELDEAPLSKPVAEKLREQQLADAEKAMRELAEKLKNKKQPPSKQELEKLRQALEKAAKKSKENQAAIEARRQELEAAKKRLLDKQQKDGKLSAADKKALDQNERQLKRLDRQKQKAASQGRQLSKLEQELAEAARKLFEDMGLSAEDLEQGAQDLNRMQREQLSREEQEELKRQIEQLRELLRQQGKGGQKRLEQLQRFGQRARGQQGKPGEGQQGRPGEGGKPGQGKPGQGKPGGISLGLGQGPGVEVPMPGSGQQPGSSGSGTPGAGDQPGGGREPGTGHQAAVAGDKTDLDGKTQDVTAAGVDSGEGTASSQVIYGAAQRGFVGRGYRDIYTDYETVAERVMETDEIPSGYKFYVQRYFQLIRPRE